MDSLEQAREALTKAWTDFLDANPDDLNSPDDLPNHALMTGEQFVQYALAALSRPVEGVKGEPVVWRARHSEQENWYLHEAPVGWWECQPLYVAPPVADSEALLPSGLTKEQHRIKVVHENHRLLKRVVELEAALKFADEQAAKLEALLEPHIKWDTPAEARLAQAERGPASDYQNPIRNDKGDIVAYRDEAGNVGWVGTHKAKKGPAVTEEQREAFCRELAHIQYEGGFRDRDIEPYADRLLAALQISGEEK